MGAGGPTIHQQENGYMDAIKWNTYLAVKMDSSPKNNIKWKRKLKNTDSMAPVI